MAAVYKLYCSRRYQNLGWDAKLALVVKVESSSEAGRTTAIAKSIALKIPAHSLKNVPWRRYHTKKFLVIPEFGHYQEKEKILCIKLLATTNVESHL